MRYKFDALGRGLVFLQAASLRHAASGMTAATSADNNNILQL
ncbi:hypothetical protein Ngar_c32420 [Candidatus Nitrososphaera gargensis Ga9.2]|uniref:Uncharacterized protein n=1 Tax=Nitrososphaera gargensis (strain Ga9.2) TaxID=1237085 RepID=K0IL52_NITGG|nr:hypothetical protein Ngar_c32420 [Candidatus Nitrososphaera gargensis Ga9.2]